MSSSTSTTVTRSQSKAAVSEVKKQEEKLVKADDSTTVETKDTTTSKDPAPISSTTKSEAAVVSESECDSSDRDSSTKSASSISTAMEAEEQEEEEDDDEIAEIRHFIAKGLSEMSTKNRIRISEEVHGIRTGFDDQNQVYPLLFKQFQDMLDGVLAESMTTTASPRYPTAAYELCLRKNYMYATNEAGELRLMCLRAELYNPAKACERFLQHLTALHKYFGEEGLMQPLTIEVLDFEERNRSLQKNQANPSKKSKSTNTETRGIYKKGKGGSKRKGSLDSLPDMLSLKSGCIQVLPSRDRCGRRVVVLQPGPSIATAQQSRRQVQHSKFKAIHYFLSTLLRRDFEAQQKGFVLVLNSTKTEEIHDESEYGNDLIEQYKELCQSIPIRFSAVHCAYDIESKKSVNHKICMAILESYIENCKSNVARVHLYDQDVSNDNTKHRIAPFGIPTHQIPVTHTGTIKLKEHNGWVKIQEWYDKKMKTDPHHFAKYNIIECPGTNDVLFSQGGKYWNGVNRFQRGNLEFMEFLESKIDIYQSTLSWKKKHSILAEVVSEFAASPQSTGGRPRFLETATQIEGVTAPDGCWVELPLASPLLMQKIRQTLLNHIRRLESSGKRKPAPSKATRTKKSDVKKTTATKKKNVQSSKDSTTKPKNPSPTKKRKLSSSPSVMKNNKLAIATFGQSISSSYSRNFSEAESLIHKQSICEFLANAERIAVSTAAVDIACESYEKDGEEPDPQTSLQDAIANDEKLVQAIIANDDRLNKEVGELFEMDHFLRDDEPEDAIIERDDIADCLMGCML